MNRDIESLKYFLKNYTHLESLAKGIQYLEADFDPCSEPEKYFNECLALSHARSSIAKIIKGWYALWEKQYLKLQPRSFFNDLNYTFWLKYNSFASGSVMEELRGSRKMIFSWDSFPQAENAFKDRI